MTAPIKSAEFFADFQGLAALKRDAKAQAPDALKQAAKQFESLFTRMLLKSMRATSMGNELFDSQQTQFYQDMFDDQMAVHLSQGKGMGLADMLVKQLQQGGADGESQSALTSALSGDQQGIPRGNRESGSEVQPGSASSLNLVPHSDRSSPLRVLPRDSLPVTVEGQGEGTPPTDPSTKKHNFITSMLPHAERAARALGVDPHALVAQAALETGWGKSLPTDANGSPSFNLFGIKAGATWNGASVASRTLEFDAGIPVAKQERFRAYDSAAQSFDDYAALIGRSPRYAAARNTGADVNAFAHALQSGGYATDPNYARKLGALTQEVRAIASANGTANSLKFADAAPLTNIEGVRG